MRIGLPVCTHECEHGDHPDSYAVVVHDVVGCTDAEVIDFVAANTFCFAGAFSGELHRRDTRATVRYAA